MRKASAPSAMTPRSTAYSTQEGAYQLVAAHTSMPEVAADVPSMRPGPPKVFGVMNELNSSHTRLQNTPTTTHAEENTMRPVFWRFFANTRMVNGMSTPTMISIQKYGAVAPKNIWDSTCQPPSEPG